MTSNEAALTVVRAQVQFELADTAAQVARAAALSAHAQRAVRALAQHCAGTEGELRAALCRATIDPAQVSVMRRLFRSERRALDDAQARWTVAQRQEDRVRAVLGGLRNRERSLERALKLERDRLRHRRQIVEMTLLDDLWLQHASREPS